MTLNFEVEEVLQALESAKARAPQVWEGLLEDPEVMMQIMEMEYNVKPLYEHLGIRKEVFPPVEKLECDEVKAIVEKILDVWSSFHYLADLPEKLPIRIAYTALLSVWEEMVMCCPVGNVHFEFHHMHLDKYINPDSERERV